MSPEALLQREYSAAGDVWAFGVLIFEVISKGAEPYEDLTITDVVLQMSQQTLALTITESQFTRYKELIELMNKCMTFGAKDRPTFEDIFKILVEGKWEEHPYDPKAEK
jgi:serine/threonine protein kinase